MHIHRTESSQMTSSDLQSQIDALRTDDGEGFDFAADPAAATAVGASLADAARSATPSVVLSWSGEDDIVLAHVVAASLGIPRASVELDLGLLTVSPALADGGRVLCVAPRFTAEHPLSPLVTMLAARGHELVLAAAVGKGQHDDGVPFIALS